MVPERAMVPAMARILVIDDEPEIRSMLADVLSEEGHEVVDAPDGRRGLALQRERAADLVITDIFMPEQEGIETILELRQAFPRVKIIAMSGGGERLRTLDYLPAAGHLGAVRTLAKPFELDAMLALVSEVLGA